MSRPTDARRPPGGNLRGMTDPLLSLDWWYRKRADLYAAYLSTSHENRFESRMEVKKKQDELISAINFVDRMIVSLGGTPFPPMSAATGNNAPVRTTRVDQNDFA
jgi:hypothetical protein